VPHIETRLPALHIAPEDGWCDDPADAAYNQPVRLSHPARHERLWREDHLYDLVLVIGHNDDPVVPGAGSAVFVHLARENWSPTEGCVVFRQEDLLTILARVGTADAIRIQTA
jgi:L,D-peptidoglycan transpeptidase YkuD (ErfK/YbiS/YcfS/YnhG family)